MKKLFVIRYWLLVIGLISVLCPLSSVQAGTNDYYIDQTGEEFDASLVYLTNVVDVIDAKLASNETAVAAMTNAATIHIDAQTAIVTNIFNTWAPTLTNNAAIIAANTVALTNATDATAAANALNQNLTNAVLLAGLADVGFGSISIATGWHNGSWTDIDISAHVGTNYAVVLLQVENNNTGSTRWINLRRPGSGTDYGNQGVSGADVSSGNKAYFIVSSNGSGVISARTEESFDITLVAWVRPHAFD